MTVQMSKQAYKDEHNANLKPHNLLIVNKGLYYFLWVYFIVTIALVITLFIMSSISAQGIELSNGIVIKIVHQIDLSNKQEIIDLVKEVIKEVK